MCETRTLLEIAEDTVDALDSDDRLVIFSKYCSSCGRKQGERQCMCWRDE
jgi:hypothetical protein